ncbi:hypothetical protein SNEBB_006773 [Seison nebaliae]|nr:hypothetical protein SNEBB_006773 [Seison nebaliae]
MGRNDTRSASISRVSYEFSGRTNRNLSKEIYENNLNNHIDSVFPKPLMRIFGLISILCGICIIICQSFRESYELPVKQPALGFLSGVCLLLFGIILIIATFISNFHLLIIIIIFSVIALVLGGLISVILGSIGISKTTTLKDTLQGIKAIGNSNGIINNPIESNLEDQIRKILLINSFIVVAGLIAILTFLFIIFLYANNDCYLIPQTHQLTKTSSQIILRRNVKDDLY